MKFIFPVIACALILGGCATDNGGLAVKRGQEHVERSSLPLVCIAFGTVRIGMPINSVTVRNAATSELQKFVVSKSFGNDRPDYLTAISKDTTLCLVTLKLAPGEYFLESIEYAGSKSDSFEYSFNFWQNKKLKFRVVDGAVNYVGSVEFSAPWQPRLIAADPNVLHDQRFSQSLSTQIMAKPTAARDCKWVYDQIPGMRDLPSVFSELQMENADTRGTNALPPVRGLPPVPSERPKTPNGTAASSGALAKELIGTWVLAGAEGENQKPAIGKRLRVFTDTHWTIKQPDPKTGEVTFHHGGTYVVEGDILIQKAEQAAPEAQYLVGPVKHFKITINGDTYTQVGLDNTTVEVWKRVPETAPEPKASAP